MLEFCLFSKMHGSRHGSKAFEGRLSIIEAVDLEFTRVCGPKNPRALVLFGFPKVLIPMEAASQPFWVKLLLTLPPCWLD
jgi:hypothetical protein